ncbi:MAG: D-aminoacylase [Spirochaetales bacterium]|nr:D-aminoacylase [Leptospiraceae bacterium]MCP5480487.1 D-aminoacylase [Spirochaetales bacterium]
MNRVSRLDFLRSGLLLGGSLLVGRCVSNPFASVNHFELLITDALICDGSGQEPYYGDVGLSNGLIYRVGELRGTTARRVISARGQAVSPGFIDLHSHSDLSLLLDGRAHSKLQQGVTTEVLGQDGRSLAPLNASMERALTNHLRTAFRLNAGWNDFSGYYRSLMEGGIAINAVSMVGSGTLREYLIGYQNRSLEADELARGRALVRQAMQDGAIGLSSGLEYLPGSYAPTAELAALASEAGLYATHMRSEDERVIPALREAITIARDGRSALHVSHIKAQGRRNWDRQDQMLLLMDEARESGMAVTCDRYPYLAYNTLLLNLFPLHLREQGLPAIRRLLANPLERQWIKSEVEYKVTDLGSYHDVMLAMVTNPAYRWLESKRLDEAARLLGRDPFDLLCDLVLSGSSTMIGFGMDEENLEKLLRYPYCAIASDGAALTDGERVGHPHPRNFGTFPRVLARYVRERRTITLQEAIRKMTSLPARILGVRGRGLIEPTYHADLVIFRPDLIQDQATYDSPRQFPTGISYVIVNGRVVLDQGDISPERPGRILQRET